MNQRNQWPQDQLDELERLAKIPGLSCADIGRQMGMSASAIVGKLTRLGLNKSIPERAARSGLVLKRAGGKAAVQAHAIKCAAPVTSFAATAKIPKPLVARSGGNAVAPCRLLDLKSDSCRWPFGDPRHEGFHFCGGKVHGNGPYCGDHAAIAWVRR